MIKQLGLLLFLLMKCFGLENNFSEIEMNLREDSFILSSFSYTTEHPSYLPLKSQNKPIFLDRTAYVELLPGYYYPMNSRIRKIFGDGGISLQVDTGAFFHEKLALFLRGGAYWADGESTVLKNKTSITLGNITFGLKYVVPIVSSLHFYVGGGGRVFFLRVTNSVDFVQRHVSSNKLGGAAITGFWLYLSKVHPIFFDFFLDYSFYKFNFKSSIASERNGLDINGPAVGIGLGYHF